MSTDIGEIHGTLSLEDQWTETQKRVERSLKTWDKAIADIDKRHEEFERHQRDAANSTTSFGARVTEMTSALFLAESAFFAIGAGARLAFAGIEKVVEWLPEIALEGSRMSSVADNFDKLAAGAGRVGEELLGSLREGTHNTIRDFELLTKVNGNLAAGLDLSAGQYKIMAEGAFALAQATGTDVKSALDKVNQALLTGQTRSLIQLTGRINMEEAEKKYAKSLGTTADHLNQEGKLQAARLGILDAVEEATGRLGEQTDGLGEIVDQVSTIWQNFEENLGETIASNPTLLAALTSIRDQLLGVIGDEPQEQLKKLDKLISDTTLSLIDLGDFGVRALSAIVSASSSVYIVFGDIYQVIKGVQLALLLLYQQAETKTTKNQALDEYIQNLEIDMQRLGKSLSSAERARDAEAWSKPLLDAIAKVRDAAAKAKHELSPEKSTPPSGTPNNFNTRTKTELKQAENLTEASLLRTAKLWDGYFDLVDTKSADSYAAQLRNIERWFAVEIQALDKGKTSNANYWNERAAIEAQYWAKLDAAGKSDELRKLREQTDDMAYAIQHALDPGSGAPELLDVAGRTRVQFGEIETVAMRAERAVNAVFVNGVMSAMPLDDKTKAIIKRLDELGVSAEDIARMLGLSFKQIDDTLGFTLDKLANHVTAWSQALTQLAQVSGDTFGGLIKELAEVVAAWDMAIQGAKRYEEQTSKTGKALAAAQMLTAVFSATGSGSQGKRALGGALTGGQMGLAIGGPVGAAIGAVAGATLGLVRGRNAQEMAVNDTRDSFQSQFGRGEEGLRRMNAAAMEATGSLKLVQDLLNAKTVDDYTRAQDALTEAINHQAAAVATINSMGFQTQKQLDDQVKAFKDAYDEMVRQGNFTAEQLAEAWRRVEEATARAAHDPTQALADAAASAGYKTRDELAKIAEDARKLAEYMRDSGKYTASQIEDAFDRAKTAQENALGVNTKTLDELKKKYDSLAESIADEAPEAVKGVIQLQTEAQMEALDKQMEAAKTAYDTQTSAAETSAQATADHFEGAAKDMEEGFVDGAERAAKYIEDRFSNLRLPPIRVSYEFDGNGPRPMAGGGRGIATEPTLFLVGEAGPEPYQFGGAYGLTSGANGLDGGSSDSGASLLSQDMLVHVLPSALKRAVRDAMLEARA